MKTSPYQTISCIGYALNDITTNLERLLLQYSPDTLENANTPLGNALYLFNANTESKIKPFAHPIEVPVDFLGKKETAVVIDVRSFTTVSRLSQVKISNDTEWRFAKMRGYLHCIWSSTDRFALNNLIPTLMPIYCSWVSESIVKRLDVNPLSQLKIAILGGFYFWCQCNPKESYSDGIKVKLGARIAEATRASYDEVMDLITDLDYMSELSDFTTAVAEKGESLRLEKLDPASLLQMMNGCWYGTNAREIASVAVEYPPYLAAMVYFSIHERGLRSAQFTKLVQRFGTKPEFIAFGRGISNLNAAENKNARSHNGREW